MKNLSLYVCLIAACVTPAVADVNVSSPAGGVTVSSPVSFAGTANTATCSRGVASMGVYIDDKLTYVVKGPSLSTSLSLSPGNHKTVIQEWDYCGGSTFKIMPVTIVVRGSVLSNVQASGGWKGWGELAPAYEICSSCNGKVTWAMNQTGGATKFAIGGTVPYSDVLWVNPVIGQGSTQGIPDNSHTLVPSLTHFIYDTWFFSDNLPASQILEFDISEFYEGKSFIFGQQCRIAYDHSWDIWDNVNNKWVGSGIPCNPVNNAWNHVVIQVQRTWDNKLFYDSITLNGITRSVNRYYGANSAPSGWYGITLNFQMDGNYKQSPYTVYLDKLSLSYW
jgi:hypothetical protein